jgi:hypothetical protein
MDTVESVIAVVAILAGFGVGYAFRGWFARRVESREERKPGV